QQVVTGDVRLRISPGSFAVEGVRSTNSLMRSELASYGERTSLWSGPEAAAFAKIFGGPQMLAMRSCSKRGAFSCAFTSMKSVRLLAICISDVWLHCGRKLK